MANFPVYEYKGEQIIARAGDLIIAEGNDFSKVSSTAEEYFNTLRAEKVHEARQKATHIVTPNGLKATILGRTSSLWDDEITVRFENGEIRHFATSHGEGVGLEYVTEQPEMIDRTSGLQTQLDEVYNHSKTGLIERLNQLEEIRHTARTYIVESKSLAEQDKLDKISMVADQEKQEVTEALAYLTSADEAIEAPKRAYAAAEQVDLGRSDSWLEIVAAEMIAESEAQDFTKLAQEEPILLVSSLDDGAIQDAGVVREIAYNHIASKTAGFQGEEIEDYRIQFIAAAEIARRKEAAFRQETVKQEALVKEASMENAIDESLFL